MLNEFLSVDAFSYLSSYLKNASEDEVYLGASSIMDPRIGTWYPESVKAAVYWYLSENKTLGKSIQSTTNTRAD